MRRGTNRLVIVLAVVAVSLVLNCFHLVSFPDNIGLPVGQSRSFDLYVSLPVKARLLTGTGVKLNKTWLTEKPVRLNSGPSFTLETADPGRFEVELLLFGVPCRRISVEAKEPDIVIPGGHAIGVLLACEGIIVVGYDKILEAGGTFSPAKDAGILPGDILLEANGTVLLKVADLIQAVEEAGQENKTLALILKRGTETKQIDLRPVETNKKTFRIGLYVREGASGVGTLSFYDPDRGCFGALGHIVTDEDTGAPLVVRDGSIVKAFISSINAGARGQPGEKVGVFLPEANILGPITANTHYGIFGVLKEPLQNPHFPAGVPVAMAGEVYPGPAKIYTVLEQDKIESFDAEIERVISQYSPTDKGLVLRITDEKLIDRAGGIIQGMSGSPIIQDGKLAGVVTHVFVNDPSRGFGILAEWMLEKGRSVLKGAAGPP